MSGIGRQSRVGPFKHELAFYPGSPAPSFGNGLQFSSDALTGVFGPQLEDNLADLLAHLLANVLDVLCPFGHRPGVAGFSTAEDMGFQGNSLQAFQHAVMEFTRQAATFQELHPFGSQYLGLLPGVVETLDEQAEHHRDE